MSSDSVASIWEAIRRYDGVPKWWAEMFSGLGFSSVEAVTWIETAGRDESSALSLMRERDLNITLAGYAAARGITLMGAGAGEPDSPLKEKLTHFVSTVTTIEEQEVILSEVDAYADVRFREKVNGVYTQHAVANAVRSVHQTYLNRVLPVESMVLEAGASVKSAVLSGHDFTKHHCCSPVLDVRDSVRHSLRGWLTRVADESSSYKDNQKRNARAALDPNSGYVCRSKVQDCTKQVEAICSNESTHDIPFDELPMIMARHGARLWVGFMTRAAGVRRVGGPDKGKCRVFGTRWKLDRARDQISFHFDRDGGFTYTHQFSQWVKYEEQFGYRWQGRYFDYVYTRMPITTAASLAFVVVRVPKAPVLLREPIYKTSHLAGMVEITSIKAVGSCTGTKEPRFEPVTFVLEALVFDRVLETRLSQGDRGNLASTIAYMRSARVRLTVNGVALGAVTSVPAELLESAAVAVEVIAADKRKAGNRDYSEIMQLAAGEGAMGGILSYYFDFGGFVGVARRVLRTALMKVLNGPTSVIVKAVRCESYVRVSDGAGVGKVVDVPSLTNVNCGCAELMSVRAALRMGSMLSRAERKDLEVYESALSVSASGCIDHTAAFVLEEEAEDQFFDATDGINTEETKSEGGSSEVTRSSFSRVETVFTRESCETDSVSSIPCVDLCDGESVLGSSDDSEGSVVKAVREYAMWAQTADRCARSEIALASDVLFLRGTPTVADVERSTTSRTRLALVAVEGGRIRGVVGTLRDEDGFAEVYVRSLGRTCVVHKKPSGERYLKENVTELCLTSTGLTVMNGDSLCRESLRVLQDLPRGFRFPVYKFVNGVPGCGKTYEIITLATKAALAGKSVMYLTATRASCDEVTKQLEKNLGEKNAVICKTYDSYVINSAIPVGKGSVDELFLDEAPMAHKGELNVVMLKAMANNVTFYGDTEQIPWLSFNASFEARYAKFEQGEVCVERRNMTHRFGTKTCAMWLDVYGQIYPCDCHEHEDILPEVISITSAVDVPELPTGKVLTFTQEEKVVTKRELNFMDSIERLKRRDRGGLSTVAEDQGGTHEDVYVVRTVNKKNPKESRVSPSIYNKQPWVLVGTTRHKRRLRYYTAADDDLVRARIDLANCQVRIEAVRRHETWSSVASKAQHVRVFGV